MTASEPKSLTGELHLPLTEGCTRNQTLIDCGRVDQHPDGSVSVHNDHFTKDAAISQRISLPEADEGARIQVSAKALPEGNSGAAVSIVALDETDSEIQISSPFRIPHRAVPQWDTYRSTISLPVETVAIRVELAVGDQDDERFVRVTWPG